MKNNHKISIILITFSLLASCNNEKRNYNKPAAIVVPESTLALKMTRFDTEIFGHEGDFDSSDVINLRKKYGKFFDLWAIQLAGIVSMKNQMANSSYIAYNLNQYVNDKYIQEVYLESQRKYKDLAWLKEEMTAVFKIYKICFPKRNIPEMITYLSPFTSNVMAMDNQLGVGLHFYLGADYKYYPSLQLPTYMTRKFSKEYMVTDLVKGWIDSEFNNDSTGKSLINEMVYRGKILYVCDLLLPDTEDSLKIGYTTKQFAWMNNHEQESWSFFIDQQLLFSNTSKTFTKYVSDGNSTSGFPSEAPAQIGSYIGWQIVRSFMKNNPTTTLEELFKMQNAQVILAQSNYKPTKKDK